MARGRGEAHRQRSHRAGRDSAAQSGRRSRRCADAAPRVHARGGRPPQVVTFIEKLSGIAAISIETRRLIAAQKALLESFIQLVAGAIDAKSPYTGGHCQRVPELTKMLARAACDAQTTGPFREFALSEDEWEALHIAGWLHDCGKVTTPEYVVDKATKLETIYDRIHEIRTRFEVLKRDAEIEYWKARRRRRRRSRRCAPRCDARWRELDDDFAFVADCNEGGEFMAPEKIARLQRIADTHLAAHARRPHSACHGRSASARHAAPASRCRRSSTLLADKPEHMIEREPRGLDAAPTTRGASSSSRRRTRYNRGEIYNLSHRAAAR